MAMVLHGFNRGTEDIDLLVDKVASNISLLKKALSILPDNAVREVINTDIEEYGVVRVADEVVVDLMGSACGIDFKSAESQIEWHELDGVKIPFASAELMLKTKLTLREKDEIDRLYLRRILGQL
jgi:DNA polymerase III delta subunit